MSAEPKRMSDNVPSDRLAKFMERFSGVMNEPEPEPTPNDSTPIWELVIADMRERDQSGRAKYGLPLQAGNGRNPLVDAYQEALDLAVYLRQEIEERSKNVVK